MLETVSALCPIGLLADSKLYVNNDVRGNKVKFSIKRQGFVLKCQAKLKPWKQCVFCCC